MIISVSPSCRKYSSPIPQNPAAVLLAIYLITVKYSCCFVQINQTATHKKKKKTAVRQWDHNLSVSEGTNIPMQLGRNYSICHLEKVIPSLHSTSFFLAWEQVRVTLVQGRDSSHPTHSSHPGLHHETCSRSAC